MFVFFVFFIKVAVRMGEVDDTRINMQSIGFGGRLNLGCERGEGWDDSSVSDLRN